LAIDREQYFAQSAALLIGADWVLIKNEPCEENGGMSSYKVLADLASRVISRYLNMGLPSPRHPLVVIIRDGDILYEMERRTLIRAEKNRTEYFPTLGTFALLDDGDERLKYAHLGVIQVLRTLINLYETRDPSTTYSLEELSRHVQDRYTHVTIDSKQIRLGLYLSINEFGVIQAFSRSEDGAQITSFMIAERALTISDPEAGWSERIALSRRNAAELSKTLDRGARTESPVEIAQLSDESVSEHTAISDQYARESNPKAFISYSWDSEQHRRWVIALATRLREKGVNVVLDHWHLKLGADKTMFMEKAVQESDHVLLICTPKYREKAEGRLGGVGWEASIVTAQLADDLAQTKFIPVLREGSFKSTLPIWLKNRVGVDLSAEPYSEDQFELLLRDLHEASVAPPPLGPAPVFGNDVAAAQTGTPKGVVKCDFSPRAELLSTELGLRAFPVVQESSWSERIELTVLADTSEIDATFSRFRGHKGTMVVSFGFDVAIASLVALNRVASGGKAVWKASFMPSRTEFSNDMEMGTSSTTADEFAEERVRRLLLNENPSSVKASNKGSVALANDLMRENLVQGLNSVVKIERSPFIDLYADFGQDPQPFVEIAWIAAVTDLKLSAAVEQIHHLSLGLVGGTMAIDFAGQRHRKYVNVPAYEIKVEGTLRVSPQDRQ
jgi:hypothetical protein